MAVGHLWITLMLGAAVFVPLLIIAILRFRSIAVAFAVSAGFSLGAMIGFFVSVSIAVGILPRAVGDDWYFLYVFAFGAAGSIGGAALALSLIRKASSDRAWERR